MFRSLRFLAPIGALALACTAPGLAHAAEDDTPARPSAKRRSNVYIVRMSEDPVVAYRGGIPGLRATKPARGQKIDPRDHDVVRYAAHLDSRHADALAHVGGGRKLYDYRYALNGFAAELSPEQAAKMAAVPGVVSVEPDTAEPIDTLTTPSFLGLTAPGGLWEQLGGTANAGEGVIIGMLDTGVWPEHPSFSDRTGTNPQGEEGKLDYHQIPGWHGKCVPGEAFNASHCNQKLIGCQSFVEGFGAGNIDESEYLSCRDSDSHGTHTASTAGGNHGVAASVQGFDLGAVSGIAPRARISAYKVCWRGPGAGALCFGSDRAAAIDQAVADGVDVLNHSIGATQTNFLDVVQQAFMRAADAGVFVAASAGNSGPFAATVAGPGPWLTTVAASTHDRFFQGSVTLGDGSVHLGASLTAGTAMLPLIHSSSAGVATDPGDPFAGTPNARPFATRVALCYLNHLNPVQVAGKIVLCDRGITARVEKGQAVRQASGAGMVLRNLPPTTGINADLHFLPAVHVESGPGAAIKAYIDASAGAAMAQLAGGSVTSVAAPFIVGFSSRGPIRATSGDILKPDLTAPGVDVLAGVSPVGDGGRLFDFFSGTSMSSPHVAGLGALFKQRHPDWSPMAIKSALMTTGTQILGSGAAASPFAQGAGHVSPNAAADPGLVYDADFDDWLAFLCGTQLPGCSSLAIDPSDLNQASIAIGDLAGVQTVTRTVTNVGPARTYTASVSAPPGIDVSVNPSMLTLGTGDSASLTVTFTRTTAGFFPFPSGFQFGSLTWSDGAGHSVKSPLVVRPVAVVAPASLSLSGASGSTSFSVKFGYTGSFAGSPHGLVAPVTTNATVADDPTDNFDTANPAANQGISVHTLSIPAGTVMARISLFDEFTDGNDDLDLFVYNPSNQLVGLSAGATSAEQVNLTNPAAGTYTIYVHGFETDGPDADFTLFTWTVEASAGNMTVVAPSSAVTATTGTVTVNWSGLAAATRYLGVVRYLEGASERGRTVVNVQVP